MLERPRLVAWTTSSMEKVTRGIGSGSCAVTCLCAVAVADICVSRVLASVSTQETSGTRSRSNAALMCLSFGEPALYCGNQAVVFFPAYFRTLYLDPSVNNHLACSCIAFELK